MLNIAHSICNLLEPLHKALPLLYLQHELMNKNTFPNYYVPIFSSKSEMEMILIYCTRTLL